jgi:hypothetical protein
MYTLKVIGARHNTLAYHRFESYSELQELLAVYLALGYKPEALHIEEEREAKAA